MDARTILWSDTGVYHRRYEKTANALIAIERALRMRRPLGGGEDEFLDLYAALAAADPEIFTKTWEDPFGHFWSWLAYEIVGWSLNPIPLPVELKSYCAALGTDQPLRTLELHLEGLKRFIVGLEITTGGTRRFKRLLEAKLPVSIPGTRLSIVGRGSISIAGVNRGIVEVLYKDGMLELSPDADAIDSDALRIVTCPVARLGDFELMLKPEAFCLPGIDAAKALLDLPEDFQRQQVTMVEEALALVQRHQPQVLDQFGELVQLVAFKSPAAGDYSNVSFSDLPGAFILSAVRSRTGWQMR